MKDDDELKAEFNYTEKHRKKCCYTCHFYDLDARGCECRSEIHRWFCLDFGVCDDWSPIRGICGRRPIYDGD